MSIELRRGGATGNGLECDLGEIIHGDPRPELGQIDRLMLCTVDYAAKLAREGPEPSCHDPEVIHSVTRSGDIWQAHIDYRGRRWSWQLLPAHWWDYQGPPIYLGCSRDPMGQSSP